MFTALNGNVRASLVGLLMANDNASRESVQQVIANYNTLIQAGFQRTEYTYFAAYLLLESENPKRQPEKRKLFTNFSKKTIHF